MIESALLALMISHWRAPYAEHDPHRQSRLTVIAEAVSRESSSRDEAVAVLTTWHHESGGFRLAVHDGSKRGDKGRAICLGQLHRLELTRSEWLSLAGTDAASTRRCARVTLRRLRRAKRYCAARGRDTWAAAFAQYGSGRPGACAYQWADDRARWMTAKMVLVSSVTSNARNATCAEVSR